MTLLISPIGTDYTLNDVPICFRLGDIQPTAYSAYLVECKYGRGWRGRDWKLGLRVQRWIPDSD
jgi:hypothetical protein